MSNDEMVTVESLRDVEEAGQAKTKIGNARDKWLDLPAPEALNPPDPA